MEWGAVVVALGSLLGIVLWFLKRTPEPTDIDKAHKIATKARSNVSAARDAVARKDTDALEKILDNQDALLDAMFSVRDKKPKD